MVFNIFSFHFSRLLPFFLPFIYIFSGMPTTRPASCMLDMFLCPKISLHHSLSSQLFILQDLAQMSHLLRGFLCFSLSFPYHLRTWASFLLKHVFIALEIVVYILTYFTSYELLDFRSQALVMLATLVSNLKHYI